MERVRPLATRRTRLILAGTLSAAALLAVGAPALSAGIVPPANPPANIPFSVGASCNSTNSATPDMSQACVASDLAQINAARAQEGVGPMYLPANYTSLTPPQQQYVVVSLERVDRGLPPLTGLTTGLDALAAHGAGYGTDPPFPTSGVGWAGSIWAGGFYSTLEADFGWMYDDGPGSANMACTAPGAPGCWGHRDIILATPSGGDLTAGAADGVGQWGTEYAMLLVQYRVPVALDVYTWADAVAVGAGVATAAPPLRPPGWAVPTRINGVDRVATAIAVSATTWANRGASGSHPGAVIIARADQFPDALAAVPLAAAAHAPLLLTGPGSLDGRDTAEMLRILPSGSRVYLIGGGYALSDAVASAAAAAGYVVNRISGPDRFATAVAIATAVGSPMRVLEANGNDFADALAAGPAAAAAGGVVLLTDGPVMPGATAAYVQRVKASTWAVGGPASAADPGATALVGADRYETAVMVANVFFKAPTVLGLATGSSFPDALAAGSQLAQEGGPLLLVRTDSVPTVTSAYIAAHSAVATLLYGGVNAVSSLVEAII